MEKRIARSTVMIFEKLVAAKVKGSGLLPSKLSGSNETMLDLFREWVPSPHRLIANDHFSTK
ncbi:hypothetical protein [Neobacillus vireti]|uniref:hypothetical protein n=1 Tax=Neobacillus vireti TaxID=220686 RepID=UPI000420F258|nr:hypothetical protein [Neobacillus vireti]